MPDIKLCIITQKEANYCIHSVEYSKLTRLKMKPASDTRRILQISDEEIFQEVYNAIVEQKMSPGMKLTEDALGEIFNVSRTRIRKILFRLEHHGLIVIESNRGAFVAKPTAKEARQVFESRRVIEIGIAPLLCRSMTPSQVNHLTKHIKAEENAVLKQDRGEVIRLAGQFHLELIKCINNEVMTGFLKQLISKTSLIISVFQRAGDSLCMTDEHMNILNAIVAKDEKKVGSLMEAHLNHVESSFRLDSDEEEEVSLNEVFENVVTRYSK